MTLLFAFLIKIAKRLQIFPFILNSIKMIMENSIVWIWTSIK